jgi:hypothetical protein
MMFCVLELEGAKPQGITANSSTTFFRCELFRARISSLPFLFPFFVSVQTLEKLVSYPAVVSI